MTEVYRKCPHCRGTGLCQSCKGTGRLALQKGKPCTICFPRGSGKCQNCRGSGGFDATGKPATDPTADSKKLTTENTDTEDTEKLP